MQNWKQPRFPSVKRCEDIRTIKHEADIKKGEFRNFPKLMLSVYLGTDVF